MQQPWLPPDARPDDRIPVPASAPDVRQDDPRAATPAPVSTRPMTVADVLDGGIAVLKAAPRTVIAIAAAILVPLELVAAWIERDSLADRGLAGAFSAATSSSGSSTAGIDLSSVLLLALSGIALALVTGAVAALLRGWYAGTAPTTGDALRTALQHAPALTVAWIIVHVAELGATVLVLIPGLLVMPLFLATSPAIVFEHLGPWAGVRRSVRMTRTRYGVVLGSALLIALVSSLLTFALSGLGLVFSFLSFGCSTPGAAPRAASSPCPSSPPPPPSCTSTSASAPKASTWSSISPSTSPVRVSDVVPPEQVRQQAKEILGRPEFSHHESLVQRILGWIGDQLSRFTFGIGGGPGFVGNLVSLIVLALIVVLLVVLVRTFVRRTRVEHPEPADDLSIELEEGRTSDDWRAQAERFEAAAQWREAMRARYRELVRALIEDGVLTDIPGRTTGEFRSEFRAAHPAGAASFDALTDLFEGVWYGGVATDAADNERFRGLAAAARRSELVSV
jgi:hypothetical protein